MKDYLSRRDFLVTALKGASLFSLGSVLKDNIIFSEKNSLFAETLPSANEQNRDTLYVIEGTDYKKLIQEGFRQAGGVDKFVKKDSYVVIKPNASWSRTPEEAGGTHPDLLEETIRLCLKSGAKKVDVIDNTCDNYKSAFKITGIGEAVKKAGGNLVSLNDSDTFTDVTIEKGKLLKQTKLANQVLSADCFINMPIAKDHSAAKLTMSMKNYMGVVKDRSEFHVKGLHQCIADISSLIKPNLIIMDCTRILLTNGPKGPGKVNVLNKIIVGYDHVAVDSLGSTYFGFKPEDIPHIKIAGEMGIGRTDIQNLKIIEKTVS